ncbi:MAG TPA: cell division protein FtsZ, partial [Methylomirabilota bacterium]|nr:cell division protein FtsZ [Methylomirabilota bacterium]
NIIFGTVIDDRMRDEVKVTVIATGFDGSRKLKQTSRFGAETAPAAAGSLDDRGKEILAEIEREREERATLEDQMGTESPFARPTEREATEVRPSERQAVPVQSLERPSYADTDLDIPSFLRRKND